MDLSIYSEDERVLVSAASLGFTVVVLNKVVTNFQHIPKFPIVKNEKIVVLNRVTFVISHASQIAMIDLRNFHANIFSLRPANEQVLKFILDKEITNFHVISLDLAQPLLSMGMRAGMKKLISLGVCFEVEFAPLLRDAHVRGICVNQCRLVLNTFADGIIFSSGAKNALELRSAFDLDVFAAGVLGLRGNPSKNAQKLVETILRFMETY